MNGELNVSGEQLEDAFALFNQMSEKLVGSYGDLEKQVAHLSNELARAHDEKFKQLTETKRLSDRLEGLLDTLPAGIVVLDVYGYISQANKLAEDMLGNKLIGQSWLHLAKRVFINEGDELRLADGRWLSITSRPLEVEPGKIILLTDISERYTLQNMLNRQQRLTSLGEMVASLAHQVRTPLASALLYLSNITHPNAKAEDQFRFTEKVKERLLHLERMVSDMLIFAGGGVAASECFNVDEFVGQLQQMLEPLLAKSNARLEINNLTSNAQLCGNSDALLGVLQNLACNAIEACDESPVLQITISSDAANKLAFCIRDNGCGIPASIKERLLEPFFTTRSNGTGLGLAVVNEVVSRFNGVIDIESEEGVGSCFRISLPLAGTQDILPSECIKNEININSIYVNKYFSRKAEKSHMHKEVIV